MARIATVFLSTGLQGTSVVKALLKDGTFKPRAVTRNVNSDAARAMADFGCEVVEAGFDDKEAIKKAVTGAECVFLVTYPFGSNVPEVTQGQNVIDASKEAGVKFMVLSSLPSVSEVSKGNYTKVAHYDDKATVQKYLEASGLSCASVVPGAFLENILRGQLNCPFLKTETGYLMHTMERPGSKSLQTWTGRDMGPAVTALFTQYTSRLSEIDKQTFTLGCCRATVEETAAELAKGLGKPVEIKRIGPIGYEAVDQMYDFIAEFDWPDYAVPDKRLEALGVKVGTIEEFAGTALKEHLKE